MRQKFNKGLVALIALVFGFSGTVAAQYGVVTNHYVVKGNVMSEKCKDVVPQIKITLRATDSKGLNYDLKTSTDENGNFSIDNTNLNRFQSYVLIAEDVDGVENKGAFEPARQIIEITKDDFIKAGYEDWDQYFNSKTTYYLGLKFRNDEPCK